MSPPPQASPPIEDPPDHWAALYEGLPIGAFRSRPDGRFLLVNPALARMVGFTSAAELVEAIKDLSVDWFVDPRRRREILDQLDREGAVRGLVSEIYHQTTRRRMWISENAYVVRDAAGQVVYYEGTVEDVSERLYAVQALERSEALLRDVTSSIPGMVCRLFVSSDGQPHYQFVSDGVRALYGIEPEVVLADPFALRRMQHPDDAAWVAIAMRDHVAQRQPVAIEFRIVLAQGETKWVRLTSSATRADPDGTLLHGLVQDITATRVAEQALRESDALRQASARAEAADRTKSELMSRISHELRTPLNAVLGFAQLLEIEPTLIDRHRSWVTRILASGRHLLSLVDDVLELSSVQSGELQMNLESVALDAAFTDSWNLVEAMAKAADVRLVRTDAPHLRVRADPKRLRQVLSNLLSNAIKYNRRAGEVHFSAHADGTDVVFEVADTGVGIAADQLDRAFRPFERLGAQHSGVEGTGLGLALCLQWVQAMHGRIELRSEIDRGSRLTVRLPAAS